MPEWIAIVDDEPDIVELVSLHLKKSGYQTLKFSSAQIFIQSLSKKVPDLAILDLMLPDGDGLDLCRQIRSNPAWKNMGVILLTAKAEETDRIVGLEIGADDYVVKPFSPRELVSRVKAVLRRSREPVPSAQKRLLVGKWVLDPFKFTVEADGSFLELTSTEFRLLQTLAENKGRVYTRDQLLNKLWGNEKAVTERTIDVHIKNLREKLGQDGELIRNIRGVGYKLD